jgi:phospholipid/cholesterol/gamma-HCH transport system substrate-binding protein
MGREKGMSTFRAGLLAIVTIGFLAFFGFTKLNPFSSPYEMKAVFATVNNLQAKSPVRIAGIEVGKVTKIEPLRQAGGGARVTMQINKKGLPIHEDAQLKVRQRIFLEGNFFVDIRPGSPSAPVLHDGGTIPINQTAAPVQFGQVLTALQSDTRQDLKTFLYEYQKGLSGKGARGFNRSIPYWLPAYKGTALANDASLGEEPAKDLQRVLRGQQRTAAGLDSDQEALKDLVSNFNTTAGALASQDVALEASVPALRDTLRVAQPTLRDLDNALPSLRTFAVDALPGVRSSNPTLKASLPFITQARRLVSRRELRGTAATLRRYIGDLVRLNRQATNLNVEARQLSACTNKVLVPLLGMPIPDPEMASKGNSDQLVRWQIQRTFPSLAGESRLHDGINEAYHVGSVQAGPKVRPAPPPDGGSQPPPHRPDIPCETQELPDLNAPGAQISSLTYRPSAGAHYVRGGPRVSKARFQAAVARARHRWPSVERAIEKGQLKNLRLFKEKAR